MIIFKDFTAQKDSLQGFIKEDTTKVENETQQQKGNQFF
jgi:hypothetical protein